MTTNIFKQIKARYFIRPVASLAAWLALANQGIQNDHAGKPSAFYLIGSYVFAYLFLLSLWMLWKQYKQAVNY